MRARSKAAAGIAAMALAAGVMAGCGSSSSDTASSAAQQVESVASDAGTATTAELTKAEFVAKANAICTKIDDVTSSLGDSADADSLSQAEAALSKAMAVAKQGVADLDALVPPAALAAAHATLVETSTASIALASRLIKAIESGNADSAALSADLQEAVDLEKKQLAAAKELGLSNCFTGDVAGDSNTDDGAND